jgi:uncharacterized protein (TIGR02300 family)
MSPTKKVPKAKPKAVKKAAPAKQSQEGRAAPKRAAEPAPLPRPKAKDARKAKPAPKQAPAPARKPPARGEVGRGAGRGAAAGADPKARLGAKHLCFKCGAKFYDLNKPEPICPKCGTDQRTRPKLEPKAKTVPAGQRKQVTRPMVPLLDDEEEDEVLVDEELDLEGVEESPDEFLDEEEEEPEEPGEP